MNLVARLERLAHLDSLLRSESGHTTEAIAAELGISVRTVMAEFDFLRECGAPIVWNRGLGHHYFDPDWRLEISTKRGV